MKIEFKQYNYIKKISITTKERVKKETFSFKVLMRGKCDNSEKS